MEIDYNRSLSMIIGSDESAMIIDDFEILENFPNSYAVTDTDMVMVLSRPFPIFGKLWLTAVRLRGQNTVC